MAIPMVYTLLPVLLASLFFSPTKAVSQGQLKVVPLPASYTTGRTPICLDSAFSISLDDSLSKKEVPGDLYLAIKRTEGRLWSDSHEFLSPEHGEELLDNGACHHHLTSLSLSLKENGILGSITSLAQKKAEERPDLEGYKLNVPLDGEATLTAKTSLGLLRGLTTFEQLFYHLPKSISSGSNSQTQTGFTVQEQSSGNVASSYDSGSTGLINQIGEGGSRSQVMEDRKYAPFGPYEIEDKPEFGWRGLHLDTSRNYFSVRTLEKMLDTMSLVKMNAFHWHITDSNSWPMDLKAFPELAEKGAYSKKERYSEEDMQHIIQFAGERGIDVMLEIDAPGHTGIIAESHPDHIACYMKPFSTYALQPPAGQLRYANDETVSWTQNLFKEVVKVVGKSPYLSTGGDELNKRCMEEDEPTQNDLRAKGWTLDQALDNFVGAIHEPIKSVGKTPVVWQELALDHGPMNHLSRDAIVDIWKNSADARAVLDKGFKIVHAPSDYFYLDCGQGGWIATGHGSNSWCDPFKSWARMLSFNPYKDVLPSQRNQVLGGQACLWAEQTAEENVEQVMWPRAAAVGELFWRGAGEGAYPRNAIGALPRMHDLRYRMVNRGVRAVPLQPHWCALRPELCVEGM